MIDTRTGERVCVSIVFNAGTSVAALRSDKLGCSLQVLASATARPHPVPCFVKSRRPTAPTPPVATCAAIFAWTHASTITNRYSASSSALSPTSIASFSAGRAARRHRSQRPRRSNRPQATAMRTIVSESSCGWCLEEGVRSIAARGNCKPLPLRCSQTFLAAGRMLQHACVVRCVNHCVGEQGWSLRAVSSTKDGILLPTM